MEGGYGFDNMEDCIVLQMSLTNKWVFSKGIPWLLWARLITEQYEFSVCINKLTHEVSVYKFLSNNDLL
jgi:hypothetical protein